MAYVYHVYQDSWDAILGEGLLTRGSLGITSITSLVAVVRLLVQTKNDMPQGNTQTPQKHWNSQHVMTR